jgi:hypothetical protein
LGGDATPTIRNKSKRVTERLSVLSNFSKKTAFKEMLANKPFQKKNTNVFNYTILNPKNSRKSQLTIGSNKYAKSYIGGNHTSIKQGFTSIF